MDDWNRLLSVHQLIESELRERVRLIMVEGKTCSLFVAMLDAQLHTWGRDFHTLIEAIEDAEALSK
jgi:hypothetical protein